MLFLIIIITIVIIL